MRVGARRCIPRSIPTIRSAAGRRMLGVVLSLAAGSCRPAPAPSEPVVEPPLVATATVPATVTCPWRSIDDVIIDSPDEIQGSLEPLAPAEVAEDLACLRRAFEHQYVATVHYRERGIDLLARLDALAAEIDGPIDPRELVSRLIELHDGAFDRHLEYFFEWSEGGKTRQAAGTQPYLWSYRLEGTFARTEAGYRSDRDPSLVVSACDGLEPVDAIVDEVGTRGLVLIGQLPTAQGLPPRTVTCRNAAGETLSLSASAIKSTGSPPEGPMVLQRDGDHLYVRIPTMDAEQTAEEEQLLALLLAADGPTTVLLDLRNNFGGDDELAFRLASALQTSDRAIVDAPSTDLVSLHALAASVSLARLYGMTAAEEKFGARLRELEATGRRFADPPALEADTKDLTEGLPKRGQRDTPYRGRVVLLVNKACASSCESMIEQLAGLDQVEVLGTHTFGAVAFGNLGMSVLPHSRIQFLGGWRYFGHVEIEGRGYAPDVYVVAEDPLAAATHHLRGKTVSRSRRPRGRPAAR